MCQLFRLLSLIVMGLVNSILLIFLVVSHILSELDNNFLVFVVIFAISSLLLSAFIFYSFGVLENIKMKVAALDEIYTGTNRYKNYLIGKGNDEND